MKKIRHDEPIVKFLLLGLAMLTFGIFLLLFLSGGRVLLLEESAVIRLIELVLFSTILGYAIYAFVKLIKRKSVIEPSASKLL